MDDGPKIRKTESMHTWRESRDYARYFVTLCVDGRKPVLTHDAVEEAIRTELEKLNADGDIRILEWVVMPDHAHLLFELGARLALGRVMARLKARTRAALTEAGGAWQRDFYEHRVRPDELSEPYAAYIFLNPYRARLIPADKAWPQGGRGEIFWEFCEHLRPGGIPAPAWIPTVKPPAGFSRVQGA